MTHPACKKKKDNLISNIFPLCGITLFLSLFFFTKRALLLTICFYEAIEPPILPVRVCMCVFPTRFSLLVSIKLKYFVVL